ncbi:MAG: AAA family ATPase, partial [Candidatus Binatia bacterium]
MLRDLRIRNFALIDELEISFEPGLNVITGETGAGKTILMHALGLSVGGKAPNDVVRTGEEEATVEAVFGLDGTPVARRLAAAEIPAGGDELLIRRVVSLKGRNRVSLNGALATLGVLESVGDGLVRVYGQHEHHTLRQAETHLDVLDAFASHAALVGDMRQRFETFRALDERLRRVTEGKEVARARAELLRYQSKEIAEAKLRSGEEEELRQERQILASAEKLAEAARTGEELLYSGEQPAAAAVGKVAQRLEDLVTIDPRLGDIAKLLDEASNVVGEAGFRLREYAGRIAFDPERLEAVELRLALILKLRRKYGESIEEILAYKE